MHAVADYLAIDLGASSGRAVLGAFDGRAISLREIHRFPNGPVQRPTGLRWDAPGLLREVTRAMRITAGLGVRPAGIGVDTWGVDYGLLGADGALLDLPFHYRDPRTTAEMAEAFARVPRDRIYSRTGIQFLALNTLYQLLADQRSGRLAPARRLLFMPDLLTYWLTGVPRAERTIASTSQLCDGAAGDWDMDLVRELGLPTSILPPIVPPGTGAGPLLPSIAGETGLGPVPVISPAAHDTASAVVGAPGEGTDWAYISSGTWSLVGRELREPVRTAGAMSSNFTNERGYEDTVRFHKNVAGLWILQECQRAWSEAGHSRAIEDLLALAGASPPFGALIDPDHASFAGFGDMPARIRDFCVRSGQAPPSSDGALVRCVLESLALAYRAAIESLERLTARPVRAIHLVGGGANNALLCRLAADATGRPVRAGPVEATAAGNVLVQAAAQRRIGALAEIRAVVARSFVLRTFEPARTPGWDDAAERFGSLTGVE